MADRALHVAGGGLFGCILLDETLDHALSRRGQRWSYRTLVSSFPDDSHKCDSANMEALIMGGQLMPPGLLDSVHHAKEEVVARRRTADEKRSSVREQLEARPWGIATADRIWLEPVRDRDSLLTKFVLWSRGIEHESNSP